MTQYLSASQPKKDAVMALVVTLQDEAAEPFRRIEAARALGMRGDARAVVPLAQMLDTADAQLQRSVIESLGRLGEPALETLLEAVQHPDVTIRQHATIALSRQRDVRSRTVLVDRLHHDPEPMVRGFAVFALAELRDDDTILAELMNALDDPDEAVQRYAVDALGRLGDPRAVPLLANTLGANNPQLRFSAVDALAQLGQTALYALIDALTVRDAALRKHIIVTIGRLGAPEAVNALADILRTDADPDVRSSAAVALGQSGDSGTVVPLFAALRDDPNPLVRRRAAYGLGQLHPREILLPLVPYLLDPDRSVRDAVASALPKFPDPPLERLADQLLDATLPEMRAAAALALGILRAYNARDAVGGALRDPAPEVRLAAAISIGRLLAEDYVEHLAALLQDTRQPFDWSRRRVCDAAAGALETIATEASLGALNDWYEHGA
ncbi:MAG: HEAT repeat domain-containing protein [Anaerolineales bacterium]